MAAAAHSARRQRQVTAQLLLTARSSAVERAAPVVEIALVLHTHTVLAGCCRRLRGGGRAACAGVDRGRASEEGVAVRAAAAAAAHEVVGALAAVGTRPDARFLRAVLLTLSSRRRRLRRRVELGHDLPAGKVEGELDLARLLALLLLAALGVRRVLLVLLALLVVLSARSSLALLKECKPR